MVETCTVIHSVDNNKFTNKQFVNKYNEDIPKRLPKHESEKIEIIQANERLTTSKISNTHCSKNNSLEHCKFHLIDTSTPENLERDFYAWLRGSLVVQITAEPTKCHDYEYDTCKPGYVNLNREECTSQESASYESRYSQLSARSSSTLSSSSNTSSLISSSSSSQILSATNLFSTYSKFQIALENLSSFQNDVACKHITFYEAKNEVATNNTTTTNNAKEKNVKNRLKIKRINISVANHIETESDVTNTNVAHNNIRKVVHRSSGTNQLGRIYSPGLPLPMIEREQIVELYRSGWKICDISKLLCVTHSCVSKILHRFRTTGTCRPKDAKEGRQESPLVEAIRDYRTRLGLIRQSDIKEQLIHDGICRRESAPSRSSINHILRTKLDLRRRKK